MKTTLALLLLGGLSTACCDECELLKYCIFWVIDDGINEGELVVIGLSSISNHRFIESINATSAFLDTHL